MEKFKRFLLIFGIFFMLGIAGCITLVVIYDPFFQYHKPVDQWNYTIDNQTSQNPGIAKNFDYDSVILGSSMTINFNTDYFAEIMGLNTVKLCYNGAFPKDNANILPIVQKTHPDVKNIFWGIDIHNYKVQENIQAFSTPDYLYDDNPWNDLPYLLNKEVILNYIILPHEDTSMSDAYSFWRYTNFSEQVALANYSLPQEGPMLEDDVYLEAIKRNLEKYVFPYLKEMPETTFSFFFPPYSILYWNSSNISGDINALLAGEQYMMEEFLRYPNAKVFYFQNNWDIVTNLDNYSDYYHYSNIINDYMTECFADGTNEVNAENLEEVMEQMKSELPEKIMEINQLFQSLN